MDNLDVICRKYGGSNGSPYWELCKQSTPADFYFAVSNSLDFDPSAHDSFTFVAIVPKAYLKKEGFMWDQSMNLKHILPEDLEEEMECIWGTNRSVDVVRKDMLARGFRKRMKSCAKKIHSITNNEIRS